MGARAAAFGALALIAACAPHSTLELPPAPPGTGTALLLDLPADGDPAGVRAVVLSLRGGTIVRPPDPYDAILFFAGTPAELGWPTVDALFHEPEAGTRLTRPLAAYALDGDHLVSAPELIDAAVIRGFRMGVGGRPACASSTACFEDEPDDEVFDRGLFCGPSCKDAPPIAPPVPPARPGTGGGCSPGWQEVRTAAGDPEIVSCRSAAAICRRDQRTSFGGGCAPIGRPCPIAGDRWPVSVPSGPVSWVSDTALPNEGDGTQAAPWALETALARADDGDVLVLSTGSHATSALGARAVRLYGACAERTELRGTTLTVTGTRGADGLTLSYADITVAAGATLDLDGVHVALDAGAEVAEGGRWIMRDSKISSPGPALISVRGRYEGTRIEHARARLRVNGPHATAAIDRLIEAAGLDSPLVEVREGARLTLSESSFAHHPDAGDVRALFVDAATAAVERVGIVGLVRGVHVSNGGFARAHQLWIAQGGRGMQAGIDGPDPVPATLVGEDVVCTDVHDCLVLWPGSTSRFARVAMVRVAGAGLISDGPAASIEARDVTMVDVDRSLTSRALALTLERVEVLRTRVGLRVEAPSQGTIGTARLSDVSVRTSAFAGVLTRGSTEMRAPIFDVAMVRVAADEVTGSGILIRQTGLRLRIEDLRLSRVTPLTPKEGQPIPGECDAFGNGCSGTGFVTTGGLVDEIEDRSSLALSRFDIEASTNGMVLDPSIDIRARYGRVKAGFIGLIDGARAEWQDRFAEVIWEAPTPVLSTEP